jgi:small basic protein
MECGKYYAERTLFTLIEIIIKVMLSPQNCSGIDTLTRKYRCRVTTLLPFDDVVFLAPLIFNALFLCGEVLVLEKELLVDTALTRSICLAITIIMNAVCEM